MSDQRLRALERELEANPSDELRERVLLERVRVGHVGQTMLDLAAFCGHPIASRLVPPGRGEAWFPTLIARFGKRFTLHYLCLLALGTPGYRGAEPVMEWLACPCDDHARAAMANPMGWFGSLVWLDDPAWTEVALAEHRRMTTHGGADEALAREHLGLWALGESNVLRAHLAPRFMRVREDVTPGMVVALAPDPVRHDMVLRPIMPTETPYGVVPAILPGGVALPIRRGMAKLRQGGMTNATLRMIAAVQDWAPAVISRRSANLPD